ncbi:hypothetical protein G6F66_012295 [Rhizopus arrhizus]|nr:hypothetical protein G6F66_012295 [Rhizopus arrhizus]
MVARFIGDNGLCARIIMDIARQYKLPGVSLLLDQEKAYDLVHPDYLHVCLTRFGLPFRLINCITSLFFNTFICVNVNGFFSAPFAQSRGLRQGDPLSLLLFNLAIEPLLRTIYASPSITGFSFQVGFATRLTNPLAQVPILKTMAYTDDLAIFLVDSGELHALLDILALYSRASNARLNRHKTLTISPSGQLQQSWQSALSFHGITHANHQLSSFLDNLLLKLQQRAQMLAQRNLSILGRSLVTNTLLLGPLWHAIRILAVPQSYLGKIRSTIIQFLARKNFPAVSFQTCQRSRKEGGLAILDPGIQHAALQLRWLQPLLLPSSDPPYYGTFVSDILRHCLRLFSVSPSHILPLLLPNMRSNTIKSFSCFSSLFRTMNKIDWQAFDIRMVNELPQTQACPYLLLPNQDFKASYWSGILVKHVYEFGMICGKSRRRSPTPTDPFRFKNKNYFRQLQLCRIQETTFFQRFKCQHNSIHMISSVLPLPALTETEFDNILDSILPDGTPIASLNTKWFRESQLSYLSTLPTTYPRASPLAWRRFWKASFPHRAHTLLWRLYHHKMPC